MSEVAARRSSDAPRTFALGNINPGDVRAEFMQSVIAVIQNPVDETRGTRFVELLSKIHGPYLDVGRNYVVEKFLAGDAEVLLFVDSDMEFTPDQVHEAVSQVSIGRPVIGGLYVNAFAEHGVKPVALNWDIETSPPQMVPIENPSDGDGLVQVGCVGTGFMAIHRSLLDQMTALFDPPCPWFAEVAFAGSQMGEDVTFCQRAVSLGHPVYVDTDNRIAHHKTVRFSPENHLAPKELTHV